MLNPAQFGDLVSGRMAGLGPTCLRGILAAAEPVYGAVVNAKNRRFDAGHTQPVRVNAPVISVGNLTVGGTGKTPLVAWLAEWFRSQGVAVTIISRGYGATSGRPNDEALELAARLPDVPHLQNPDRVAAARQALAANPRQVLDSGRRLSASPARPRSRHRAARRPGAVRARPAIAAGPVARAGGESGPGARGRALAGRCC